MKKYMKLLSPHFSEEQIENLIPIIELMQDPFSFEIGILQLKGQTLYDSFISFLKDYSSQYLYLNGVDEMVLLLYMFCEEIVVGEGKILFTPLVMQNNYNETIFKRVESFILIPIFSRKLDIVESYNCELFTFIYHPNCLPPISITGFALNFNAFPPTTWSVELRLPFAKYLEVKDMLYNCFNAIPSNIVKMECTVKDFNSYYIWSECLSRFNQLKTLYLHGNDTSIDNIIKFDLPPNIEDLKFSFTCPLVNADNLINIVSQCLDTLPTLSQFSLYMEYFDDNQIKRMNAILAKYNFNYNPTKDLYERIS